MAVKWAVWWIIYLFLGDVGNYYYGQGHPMKPHRIRMTHNLLLNYGLYRKMEIYVRETLTFLFLCTFTNLYLVKLPFFVCLSVQRPHKANAEEMTKYHSDDYIKFLRSIRPDNMSEYSKQMQRCEFPPHKTLKSSFLPFTHMHVIPNLYGLLMCVTKIFWEMSMQCKIFKVFWRMFSSEKNTLILTCNKVQRWFGISVAQFSSSVEMFASC